MSCCSVCGIELPMIQRDRGVHPGCEPVPDDDEVAT